MVLPHSDIVDLELEVQFLVVCLVEGDRAVRKDFVAGNVLAKGEVLLVQVFEAVVNLLINR